MPPETDAKLLEDCDVTISNDLAREKKSSLLKQGIALFLGIFFSFSAFKAVLCLQSTIHIENSVGALSVTVIYAVAITWCAVLTPTVLQIIGAKKGLILSEIAYVIFVIGNLYPATWVMIIASMCGGIAEGVIWPSISILCVQLSHEYSKISNKSQAVLESKMFGQFYGVMFATMLIGNAISYGMLAIHHNQEHVGTSTSNSSHITTHENNTNTMTCGVVDCQQNSAIKENISHYVPTEKLTMYLLIALFAIMGLFGTFIHFKFLKLGSEAEKIGEKKISRSKPDQAHQMEGIFLTLKSTALQFINPMQLLLNPINLYFGAKMAFMISEFTRAYVACFVGVEQVGLVVAVFGLSGMVSSTLVKYVSNSTRKNIALLTCAAVDFGLYAFCMHGEFSQFETWKFYVASAVQGITLGVSITVSNKQCTEYFTPEKHGAAFCVWSAIYMTGIMIVFAISAQACVRLKLYIFMGINLFAHLLYAIAEIMRCRRQKIVHDDKLLS